MMLARLQCSSHDSSHFTDQASPCAPQLRVGQPPGSSQPLVTLAPEIAKPFDVLLYEARAGDPNVPQGKAYARLQAHDLGFIDQGRVDCSFSAVQICESKSSSALGAAWLTLLLQSTQLPAHLLSQANLCILPQHLPEVLTRALFHLLQ